jgi:hypothetical protein
MFLGPIDSPNHSVNAFINAVKALIDSIKTLVDSVAATIDCVKPGFDVRQALADLRELGRKPSLECSANCSYCDLLALLYSSSGHGL